MMIIKNGSICYAHRWATQLDARSSLAYQTGLRCGLQILACSPRHSACWGLHGIYMTCARYEACISQNHAATATAVAIAAVATTMATGLLPRAGGSS
jgi:hypothetical protein